MEQWNSSELHPWCNVLFSSHTWISWLKCFFFFLPSTLYNKRSDGLCHYGPQKLALGLWTMSLRSQMMPAHCFDQATVNIPFCHSPFSEGTVVPRRLQYKFCNSHFIIKVIWLNTVSKRKTPSEVLRICREAGVMTRRHSSSTYKFSHCLLHWKYRLPCLWQDFFSAWWF